MSVIIERVLADVYTPDELSPVESVRASLIDSRLQLTDPDGQPSGGADLDLESQSAVVPIARLLIAHALGGGGRAEIAITQAPNSPNAAQRILFEPAYNDGTDDVLAKFTIFESAGTSTKREMSLELFEALFEAGGGTDRLV